MHNNIINLAFVGAGPWARKHHFPALDYLRTHAADRFDVRLRGIFSLERAEANAVAGQYGFDRVYDSLDALIADRDVNAVAMAVPPEAAVGVAERLTAMGVLHLPERRQFDARGGSDGIWGGFLTANRANLR